MVEVFDGLPHEEAMFKRAGPTCLRKDIKRSKGTKVSLTERALERSEEAKDGFVAFRFLSESIGCDVGHWYFGSERAFLLLA
jgi:hypothetical protein